MIGSKNLNGLTLTGRPSLLFGREILASSFFKIFLRESKSKFNTLNVNVNVILQTFQKVYLVRFRPPFNVPDRSTFLTVSERS